MTGRSRLYIFLCGPALMDAGCEAMQFCSSSCRSSWGSAESFGACPFLQFLHTQPALYLPHLQVSELCVHCCNQSNTERETSQQRCASSSSQLALRHSRPHCHPKIIILSARVGVLLVCLAANLLRMLCLPVLQGNIHAAEDHAQTSGTHISMTIRDPICRLPAAGGQRQFSAGGAVADADLQCCGAVARWRTPGWKLHHWFRSPPPIPPPHPRARARAPRPSPPGCARASLAGLALSHRAPSHRPSTTSNHQKRMAL